MIGFGFNAGGSAPRRLPPVAGLDDALLLETGDALLLEDGGRIILEQS